MPRGDGTGPNAMGSGTGRAMGYCSGAGNPGFATAPGRGGAPQGGFGQGGFARGGAWGCGRGRRGGGVRGVWRPGPGAFAPMDQTVAAATADWQRQDLERQAMNLEASLESVRARLRKLDDEGTQS